MHLRVRPFNYNLYESFAADVAIVNVEPEKRLRDYETSGTFWSCRPSQKPNFGLTVNRLFEFGLFV